MLKSLLKVEFLGLLSALTTSRDKKTAKPMSPVKIILFALLFLFVIASCVVAFIGLFILLGSGLAGTGNEWLLFAVMALLVFLVDFITTIFMTKSKLFEAKDNDLLLSMPIRPRDILLSRMLFILISDYFFELVVAIPAYIVWCIIGKATVVSTLLFLLSLVFLPLLALSLASLAGWLLSVLVKRMKRKSLYTTLLYLVFFGVYMATVPFLQTYMNLIITHSEVVAEAVKTYLGVFYLFGNGIASESLWQTLLFCLSMLLPFALTCYILSSTFHKVVTRERGGRKVQGKAKAQKATSLTKALLRKDLKLLSVSSGYLLNAGMGLLFVAALAVAVFFMPTDQLLELLPGMEGVLMPSLIIVALCMTSGMVMFSAPSLNVEGQDSITLLQSLPIRGRDVLLSKVYMHLVVTCPVVLVASICALIALPSTPLMGVLVVVIPQLYNLFIAVVGLCFNLAFPKFDYESEMAAAKQSIATLFSMLVGMLGTPALGVGGLFLSFLLPVPLAVCLVTLIPIGITVGLFLYIWKCGDRVFAKL